MENLIKYIPTYFLYTLINMTFYLYFRAVFKFDQSNKLGVTATGKEFGDFKTHFEADERGFGYIRIKTGDEISKRAKFVLVTWVGQNVSVMKKAKMSTDKALLKDIIQVSASW